MFFNARKVNMKVNTRLTRLTFRRRWWLGLLAALNAWWLTSTVRHGLCAFATSGQLQGFHRNQCNGVQLSGIFDAISTATFCNSLQRGAIPVRLFAICGKKRWGQKTVGSYLYIRFC